MIASKHVRWIAGLLFLVTLCVALAQDAPTEHAAMKKEHAQAHADHDAWQLQIGKHRVEHRKALATLREIEARILEHEASLEELSNHVAEHEDHIRHHDDEIGAHEKTGDDKDHEKLAAAHKKVMAEHAEIHKALTTFHDDHDRLMAGLDKLREMLSAKK